MKDVRARAEERARRYMSAKNGQQSGPPGGGFESERTQAKEALRAEINTQNGQNVQKIAAEDEIAQKDRILRVAAYCRVSTDDIDTDIGEDSEEKANAAVRDSISSIEVLVFPEERGARRS